MSCCPLISAKRLTIADLDGTGRLEPDRVEGIGVFEGILGDWDVQQRDVDLLLAHQLTGPPISDQLHGMVGLTTWQTKTMPRIKALEPMTTDERNPIVFRVVDTGNSAEVQRGEIRRCSWSFVF